MFYIKLVLSLVLIISFSNISNAVKPPIAKDLAKNPFYRRDYEYNKSFQSFYKHHNEVKKWTEAVLICSKEDAELFVPETVSELEYIIGVKNKLETVGPSGLFVGIHGFFEENKFWTLSGSTVEHVPVFWAPGHPTKNKCVTLRLDKSITTTDCDNKLPFVCKRKLSSLKYNDVCKTWDPAYFVDPTGSRCYKVHPTGRDWNEGFATCHAEHSYLSVINSQTEADLFVQELNKYPRYSRNFYYWDGALLGFHDLFIQGEFRTLNGELLAESGYNKWVEGQPSGGTERCGDMIINGHLNDQRCSSKDVFICEREISNFTTAARRIERCGHTPDVLADYLRNNTFREDYSPYGKNFYKLHRERMSWTQAERQCRSEDALLAVPESREEVDFMLTLLRDNSSELDKLFVGIHDIFSEGVFLTVEGVDVSVVYNEWEFQGAGDQDDCVSLEDGGYRAVFCDLKMAFICKKNLDEPNAVPCDLQEIGYFPGVDDKYYKLYTEPKNWGEAQEICHSHHSQLAKINSMDEAKLLSGHLAGLRGAQHKHYRHLYDSVHVAVDDCNRNKMLFESSGNILNIYFGYEGRQQGGRGVKHCRTMYANGFVVEGACDKEIMFYCELKTNSNTIMPEEAIEDTSSNDFYSTK